MVIEKPQVSAGAIQKSVKYMFYVGRNVCLVTL